MWVDDLLIKISRKCMFFFKYNLFVNFSLIFEMKRFYWLRFGMVKHKEHWKEFLISLKLPFFFVKQKFHVTKVPWLGFLEFSQEVLGTTLPRYFIASCGTPRSQVTLLSVFLEIRSKDHLLVEAPALAVRGNEIEHIFKLKADYPMSDHGWHQDKNESEYLK